MNIEQIIANKDGWFTPQEATNFYGHGRSLEEIVLHHWDNPAARPAFAGNLDYLLSPQTHGGVPTANTIIGWDESQNKVRIIDTVVYPNVAFTSSGASIKNDRAKYINCVSVGIEIDPFIEVGPHRAELIEAVGYRVWQYRKQAGRDIPLTGHNRYVYTDCPGAMPFNEIEQSAQNWAKGDDMYAGKSAQQWAQIANDVTNIANTRLGRLQRIGAAVSVKDVDSEHGTEQVIANVGSLAGRVDQLTGIVSSTTTDAAAKLAQIEEIIKKK